MPIFGFQFRGCQREGGHQKGEDDHQDGEMDEEDGWRGAGGTNRSQQLWLSRHSPPWEGDANPDRAQATRELVIQPTARPALNVEHAQANSVAIGILQQRRYRPAPTDHEHHRSCRREAGWQGRTAPIGKAEMMGSIEKQMATHRTSQSTNKASFHYRRRRRD
jgi:hypothetical protein